jgi:hypothetical protein
MPPGSLFSCFDFLLRSDIPLTELDAAGAGDTRPVVPVRLGSVPESTHGMDSPAMGLRVCGEDALLTVEQVGRYLVRGDREIVIEPAAGSTERSIRLFLLGSALGILCHRRGLMPLHANAVIAGGDAFAFAGPSGAGKSTLASHFVRAGYPVLCDDVCVIAFAADGTPLAWPGLRRLKLWDDAAQALGHDREKLERVVEGFHKYQIPLPPARMAEPVPLRRLYILGKAEDCAPGFRRLRGQEAMHAVIQHTYRGAYLRPLGLAQQNFRHAAMLLALAEAWEVHRAWGYDVFEREAAQIERHMQSAAARIAPQRRAS